MRFIKIVSPEEQQKIVDYCDNLQMIIDKLEENIENNNTLMKTILENKLKQLQNKTIITEINNLTPQKVIHFFQPTRDIHLNTFGLNHHQDI